MGRKDIAEELMSFGWVHHAHANWMNSIKDYEAFSVSLSMSSYHWLISRAMQKQSEFFVRNAVSKITFEFMINWISNSVIAIGHVYLARLTAERRQYANAYQFLIVFIRNVYYSFSFRNNILCWVCHSVISYCCASHSGSMAGYTVFYFVQCFLSYGNIISAVVRGSKTCFRFCSPSTHQIVCITQFGCRSMSISTRSTVCMLIGHIHPCNRDERHVFIYVM